MADAILSRAIMTYEECIKFDSQEAKRVCKILNKIEQVKFPEDLIMYQILKGAKNSNAAISNQVDQGENKNAR